MDKKFVGKVLSGVMGLSRSEINKKQDKMSPLTSEDVKDMYPPFSVKEELSKSAPVQITLLDADDQPLAATKFTVKKSTSVLTSGKTNDAGSCVYNKPEVMTCDILPCSLEYNEKSIEIDASETAKSGEWIEIELKDNLISKITGDAIGDLSEWIFDIDDTNNTIILKGYAGDKQNIVVHGKYTYNGKDYTTRLYNGTITANYPKVNPIESVTFKDSIDYYGHVGRSTYSPYHFSIFGFIIFGKNAFDSSNNGISIIINLANDISKVRPVNMENSFAAVTVNGYENLNTEDVINMKGLFRRSGNTNLDLKNFNTSNVTTMQSMFDEARSLRYIDLSSFDTSKVTNMNSMFARLDLETLDLTSFDICKVTDMQRMFAHSTNLKEILVSRSKWVIPSGCKTSDMFYNCGVDHVTYVD